MTVGKHVREALRRAGLRQSDVTITCTGNGHPHIVVGGRTVITSSSPRDHDVATRILAKKLLRAVSQQGAPA